jgi:dTMP kinase
MFISFEGIDFSGKSTQIKKLCDFLDKQNKKYLLVREPGGTRISEMIREILLSKENMELSIESELFLYLAARAQLVDEKIIPNLENYDFIIADRFIDSTYVYQGYGRELDKNLIRKMNQFAIRNCYPKISFLIDISVEESIKRRNSAGRSDDRIESAGNEFFEKVRNGYLDLAKSEANRIQIINGDRDIEEIHLEILKTVKLIE